MSVGNEELPVMQEGKEGKEEEGGKGEGVVMMRGFDPGKEEGSGP